ncbi:MAG: hypothetical protein J6A69_10030 [Clostridia bacterium]|nr:hypothetical protein [Clostridia bacterium]
MSILIISDAVSDLSNVLMNSAKCDMISFKEAEQKDLTGYTALALLCGTENIRPRVLSAALRIKVEEFAEIGKPIFYEWCASLGHTVTDGDDYNDGRDSMSDTMNRYIYIGNDNERIKYGDLVDSQANRGCNYIFIPENAYPVLYNGGHIISHDHVDKSEINTDDIVSKDWRLWYYDKNRLVCSFRISNFVKARFAPFESWCGIIEIILKHLGIEKIQMPEPYYKLGSNCDAVGTFDKGLKWFDGCNILIDNGKAGAREGMAHPIYPDGIQAVRQNVRVDCIGEIAGAYLFDYILNNNKNSLSVYKNLSDFIFDKMQIKSGKFAGMLRWTEGAWCTVYGDDTGRAVISTLLYMMYTEDLSHLPQVEAALEFLISITGTDGLMEHGVHTSYLTDEKIKEMTSKPSNQYCAHRNAYYSAALLLAYRLNNKQIYYDTAVKGLSTIMGVYPETMRAISETEELCRLVFPLSCLYQVTGNEEHKNWLYDVCERLENYHHESGGYTEVDPGYKAYRSRTAGTESSMLADNGNEIAELLYSLNWLPLGFSYAYYVTKDNYFLEKWESIAKFMSDTQIVSKDRKIDGAWSRCIDLKRMEVYGMPHDVGWGPHAIESGWTVAEILMGLGLGIALKNDKFPEL